MKCGAREFHVRGTSIIGLFLLLLSLASCKEGPFYTALGDQVAKIPLRIAPASATIVDLTSMTFSATGGVPPYTYSKVSGPGSVNRATGVFLASGGGTVRVRVTDKKKETSDATIIVTPTGLLTINPTPVSVSVNTAIQFVAVGGTGPYSFSIDPDSQSGGSIDAGTGLYRSGFTLGTDHVTVTDLTPGTPQTKTATITVTAAATNVNYLVQSATHPATATSGRAISGYDFKMHNSGVAPGTQDVNWWVYLSGSATLNAPGTVLLGNDTTGPLPNNTDSLAIPITGTWPVVSGPVTKYLYIMIAAPDDLDSTNNVAGPFSVLLSPPDVNYSATKPTQTGPLVAGGDLSESFIIHNSGLDRGSQSVYWTAYVSTNSFATIDVSPTVIDSGSIGPLDGSSDSLTIPLTGAWPSAAGSYYLKLQLSAADDIDTGDNIQVSDVYNTTHVDYTVDSVSSTGPWLAGNAIDANFTLENVGNAKGSQPVNWSAYLSTNDTLDAGDTLVASSTTGYLDPHLPSVVPIVPITATWPKIIGGTYYLIVSVSASDDTGPTTNVKASSGYVMSAPNVNYVVSVTDQVGSALPAGTISRSFQLSNIGPNNGSQLVSWSVYASLTSAFNPSAILIASGVSQPLASGAPPIDIPFSGQWPLHYGNYHLVVSASVVEATPMNIVGATLGTTPVGIFNETTDSGSDFPNINNAMDLGITLLPGMSVSVSGSMNSSDTADVFAFNTGSAGSAASITVYLSLSAAHSGTLYFMDGPNSFPQTGPFSSATDISLSWARDFLDTTRWISIKEALLENFGSYSLIITGN